MSKQGNAINRLKKNYTYTVQQLQEDFGFHPQTIRKWVKDNSLPVIQQRPMLIFSEVLRNYFIQQRKEKKAVLEHQQMYCLPCRQPRLPLESKVHYEDGKNVMTMRGVCPECNTLMLKKQSKEKALKIQPLLKTISLRDLHILQRANSNEETHLSKNLTSHSNEPANNTHLQKQIALL